MSIRIIKLYIVCYNNLGQIPTQRAIGTGKIMNFTKLIDFVEYNVQLVVHTDQRIGQNGQCFPGGTRFVRIEKEQNDIGAFGIPLNNLFTIICVLLCIIYRNSSFMNTNIIVLYICIYIACRLEHLSLHHEIINIFHYI